MGLLGGASSTSVSSSDETKPMAIYVTYGEQNMSFEVQRGDRVENLKAKIREQVPALDPAQMRLTHKETAMQDGQKLSECGCKNRSRCVLSV